MIKLSIVMKKSSIADMQVLAIEKGGKCLSSEYQTAKTKLQWQCKEGHIWDAVPSNVKQGKWCPFCAGRYQTIDDMRKIARTYGGECLSSEYQTARTKLKWKCNKGHSWDARPDNVRHGNWCPVCARERSAIKRMGSIEDFHAISRSHDGICLSEKYLGNNIHLRFQCVRGHEWEATPANIRRGKWCPICAGVKRHTIEFMHRIATAKGGSCLSTSYVNRTKPLVWKCKEGHIWKTPGGAVISGRWCPACGITKAADARRGDIEYMMSLANDRGGKCLSEYYKDTNTHLLWECAFGHTWKATPGSVKTGSWCPNCSSGFGERICRAYMEQLFGEKFPRARPRWLRTPEGSQLELDGYCKEFELAFEHHGPQHFVYVEHFHRSGDAFEHRQYLDDCKRRLCSNHGVRLIEILEVPKYISINELKTYIKQECENLMIEVPHDFDTKYVDLKEAYTFSSQNYMRELMDLALEREGKLLSHHYLSSKTKLRWMCKNGHIWEALPHSIKRGSWCKKCSRKIIADRQSGNLDECKHIAEERGGYCLSTEYINVESKLKWQCKTGHVWYAKPANIKQGQWCPTCSREKVASKQRGTIKDMQMIAKKRGGRCLSNKYVNSITKLLWKCSEGHTWQAPPGGVKFGQWCPICSRKISGRKRRLLIEDLKKIARSRMGDCISDIYEGNHSNLKWKCKDGHIWKATPANVKRGTWCPYCARYKQSAIQSTA